METFIQAHLSTMDNFKNCKKHVTLIKKGDQYIFK